MNLTVVTTTQHYLKLLCSTLSLLKKKVVLIALSINSCYAVDRLSIFLGLVKC